ncbi:enhancer of mRNA-decapping protein 4-like isoform X2 [Asterias rubens]|nr:enhancer of mRNA-decapping protein 4-like isoform X2 [Asterias rubens]
MDRNAGKMSGAQVGQPQDIDPDGTEVGAPRSLESKVRQTIALEGDDNKGSVAVYGRDVSVIPSDASKRDSSAPGSNKVKITPVVKYDWEHKYYIGDLVAVNQSYLVYVLKIQSGYGLRILDRRTSVRALLKGFDFIITDVAFAHHQSNTLGCIDRIGNITVWNICEADGNIMPTPKLKIIRPGNTQPSDYHRLVWCPYLPDDPSNSESSSFTEENSRLLAVTHNEKAEFWDLDVVVELFGNVVESASITEGVIRVTNGHTKPITDLSVAPDGQVLATASEDGTVKFWQMDMAMPDTAPSQLHRFVPHDGKPLSALIFCDNHKYQDPDLPFWRFLITGANSNQELMMWCTVSWTCLQKISFSQPSLIPEPFLKIKLDLSASFLMVTDITRKVLYVLQVHQDHSEGRAHISSISEFLLTQPTLSFAIVDAGKCRLKTLVEEGEEGDDLNSGDMMELLRDGSADTIQSRNTGVIVKMFCINSRSVQDLQVRFKPSSSVEQDNMAGSVSSASIDDYALQDGLSDMSMNTTDHSVRTDIDGNSTGHHSSNMTSSFTSESTNHSNSHPYLMTPDAIMSSSAKTLAEHLRESNSTNSSFTQISGMNASVDELLSSMNSSDHTRVITPDSPVTLTPGSSLPATPSSPKKPEPLAITPVSEDKPRKGAYNSDDEGPKSPPPTPTDLGMPALIPESNASTEDLAELLENSRLKEKRVSDSSAEVAQILQSHLDNQQEETEQDVEEDEDGDPIPVVRDALPVSPRDETEAVQEMDEEAGRMIVNELADEGDTHGREVVVIGPKQEENGAFDSNDATHGDDMTTPTPGEGATVAASHSGDGATVAASYSGDDGREQSAGGVVAPVAQQLLDVQDQESRSEQSSDVEPADSTSPSGERSKTRKQRRDKFSRASPRPRKTLAGDGEGRSDIPEINNTLQQVLGLLQSQQQEMKQMRQDIIKSQQANSIIQSMRSRIDRLDKTVCTKIESTMAKQSEQERQRLTTALQERQSMDKQKQERLLECVSQNVNKSITSRLDKTVRSEIDSKVVPEIQKLINPMSEQLSTIVAQKLTATDQLMTENIGKLVKSKGVTEAIGQSAATALSSTVKSTYRDAFQRNVIPAFDNSCQSLFQQVNAAFDAGTRQYTHQLEAHLGKLRQKEKESKDPIIAELMTLVQSFQANTETLKTGILSSVHSEIDKQLQKSNKRMEEELLSKVQKLLKDELRSALRDHQSTVESSIAAVVRSQAPTPVPQGPDIRQIQSQITQYLQQGHIVPAFQTALSAADLRAVIFVCNAVKPDDLFGTERCPLDQPVLLSLIQQLSHDLGNTTLLKLQYIEEALVVLADEKAATQYHEHLPIVINELCNQISTFLQQNASNTNAKKMKRLLMLAQSLK